MKASILSAAAVIIALTSSAYAAEPVNSGEGYQGYTSDVSSTSTRTRAEVKAETIAALRDGLILSGETYPASITAPSQAQGKTRQEVRAELAQAIKAGTLPRYE
ncbi:hypothetical protein ASD15_21030 [Massilia sp. Root351]|jgi:hypothetical protein|uniref:DUF4148 domain-containing protein n=1 Tax=Massilia sp. Root351 TaxID=1736522 RepID=UPI00070DD830|nr:DUF4148 domain-containing protein [Massilia sp. Root351]KQV79143.1 hypothetical protein ASD15_21030 [Massilia sp. Root351]